MPLENPVDASDGLAVATGGAKEAAVTVQMAQEGDLEAKRILKEQQAEAKRQANALPVWIAQSTVNGELTGAGIKEGVSTAARPGVSFVTPTVVDTSDVKVDGDVDYDAYFANLQSHSGPLVSSSHPFNDAKRSPSDSTGSLNSPAQSCASSIGNGLKRPRPDQEFVDEGYASLKSSPSDHHQDSRTSKKAKVEIAPVTSVSTLDDTYEAEYEEGRTMTLGGKVIDISQVTEEMEQQMVSCALSQTYLRPMLIPLADSGGIHHLRHSHHGRIAWPDLPRRRGIQLIHLTSETGANQTCIFIAHRYLSFVSLGTFGLSISRLLFSTLHLTR